MTFPPEGRFTGTKLRDWLKPQLQSGALVVPDKIPDMGRIVKITIGGATGGLSNEGLFDAPAFQIQCRGAENNYDDAESIAYEVDDILIKAPNNIMVGDCYVQVFDRVGGAPQAMQLTDPQSRYVFTCNYFAIASTGV